MSKRKYNNDFFVPQSKKSNFPQAQVKKHTLDSDEEDNVDEDNVLDTEEIEGEEDGIARQDDGGQRMTAFNMQEEMEEGHFDRQGHFIWNNEKEIKDNWLDNIDWQKIKNDSNSKGKYRLDDEQGLGASSSESEDESQKNFNETATYKKMIEYMKPKESVNKALKRLGGADMKLSSVERLKRKKAGTLTGSEDVTNLTELANQILSNLGNMDVYQETYEQIQRKIDSKEKKNKATVKEPELDMYADDFDSKENQKRQAGSSSVTFKEPEPAGPEKAKELLWEFKWTAEDSEVQGPYNTAQMVKWSNENHFKSGVLVRKCGENSNFYTSNRIDFELYE